MKIWWCENHDAEQIDPKYNQCFRGPTVFPTVEAEQHRCRMVKMRLVPEGAVVIERENLGLIREIIEYGLTRPQPRISRAEAGSVQKIISETLGEEGQRCTCGYRVYGSAQGIAFEFDWHAGSKEHEEALAESVGESE